MSKYTLEAYEKYKTVKCRPQFFAPETPRLYKTHSINWCNFEQERAEYNTGAVPQPQKGGMFNLVVPGFTPPAFLQNPGVDLYAGFIRRLGAAANGGLGFDGVLLQTGGFTGSSLAVLAQAYKDAFSKTFIILPSGNSGMLCQLQSQNISFGLLLDVQGGILPLRQWLAQNRLQKIWEKCPVLMQVGKTEERQEALLDAAQQWHVCAADTPLVPGGLCGLRRLTYPQDISSGGALPLRFWWQVAGSAPVYCKAAVRLRLAKGSESFEIALSDMKDMRPLGDAAHNEIAQLPKLPPGEYSIECGLFGSTGPLPLGIKGQQEGGWYAVGSVNVDETPRPQLFDIWDNYYPEGYYPLEDPKLPN